MGRNLAVATHSSKVPSVQFLVVAIEHELAIRAESRVASIERNAAVDRFLFLVEPNEFFWREPFEIRAAREDSQVVSNHHHMHPCVVAYQSVRNRPDSITNHRYRFALRVLVPVRPHELPKFTLQGIQGMEYAPVIVE